MAKNNARIAIVDGHRTPFCKSFTDYKGLTAVDLAQSAVAKLIDATELPPKEIDEVIFSCVVPPVEQANIGREVVLRLGLPPTIPGYTLIQACTSSFQTVINACQKIGAGKAETVICGGVEALSTAPVPFPKRLITTLYDFSKAKSFPAKLNLLKKVKIGDLFPKTPQLTEPSTGLSMGEHAEKMAKENGISREQQDSFAYRSHKNASDAAIEGRFDQEIAHVFNGRTMVTKDNCIRLNPDLDKLTQLQPVFDRKFGTVTAGNSSPLTDGASALLIMSEEKAKAMGYEPLGYVTDYANAALDPRFQLLLGPMFSTKKLFSNSKLNLKDMDLIDIHEAFAVPVLSLFKFFPSKTFAKEHFDDSKPIGEIDLDKVNVYGGSIALGHPFAATGARMIMRTLRELKRLNKRYALLTGCAAGAMGTSMIVETE